MTKPLEPLMSKPRVDLGNIAGPEGNAYCILGRCSEAAKNAGWTTKQVSEFKKKAMAGSYADLLATVEEHFTVGYAGRPSRGKKR